MIYHQIKNKLRPLTPAEQAGMTSLLSGIKKLKEKAAREPPVASMPPRGDVSTAPPIPRQGSGD